jgi:dihydrofolate reductase
MHELPQNARVRVYIASSFDGFIAGANDDLSWLPGADPNAPATNDAPPPQSAPGSVAYADFIAGVGALLMGRRTFDVVLGFGGDWPYGERPVLVATHRPLTPGIPHVEPVTGTIEELIALAKRRAGSSDVYLDGGNLIRQALGAGLVDDLIVTLVPELLGQGHPLFAGLARRCSLEFTGCYPFGAGMLQIHARPKRRR